MAYKTPVVLIIKSCTTKNSLIELPPYFGGSMAFVRKKGHQVAIVQGDRDPESGEVNQSTLFTFFSKAEVLRALGRGPRDHSSYFQHLLQEEYPAIKFNWKALNKGLEDHLDVLPDLAEYREQRLVAKFKDSLHAFTREIVQTEPQSLVSSARLLLEHKQQLEFLSKLLEMKLKHIATDENEFNGDNEFYWHHSLRGQLVNGEVEQMAADIYRTGNDEEAIAAFSLLTDSFLNYAEGHNYLGLIHLRRNDLVRAIEHFRKTVLIGRKMFPKRISKQKYWSDHATRPYMRGLRNLSLALLRQASFDEALAICDTLEKECGDDISAASYRSNIFLNTKQWSKAEQNALKIIHIDPMAALVAAFSQFEGGTLSDARINFMFATFNDPLGVEMVLKRRARKPQDALEFGGYSQGVEMLASLKPYMTAQSKEAKTFFSSLWMHPEISALREEVVTCARQHFVLRDKVNHHKNFERWHEMKSLNFAKKMAQLFT